MQLESSYGIELEAFIDLIRLVTGASPDRPSSIFKWEEASKYYYGSFAIFPGYYELRALPVLFFWVSDTPLESESQSLVKYDLQAKSNQITFLSFLEEKDLENVHTGLIRFIPIVKLKHPPKIFSNLG
ncbi:MAG: hypothetical protein EAX86_12070 [Candidatus Heimdallarchaeota archaeon]|nr:hypothetical protein [Candidatus Heimdallarchaeota archaeon]